MKTSIHVLDTPIQYIKLRSSRLITKSDAQKQMVESDFECRFHDHLQDLSLKVMLKSRWLNMILNVDYMTLSIFKLEFFSFFLNSLSTRRHHNKHLSSTIKFNVVSSYYMNINLNNCLFNITYLHRLLKCVDFS